MNRVRIPGRSNLDDYRNFDFGHFVTYYDSMFIQKNILKNLITIIRGATAKSFDRQSPLSVKPSDHCLIRSFDQEETKERKPSDYQL